MHPGIFLGRALWADSVSPRTNTIASRDQFKPIRIGENLVVNYKHVYSESLVLSLYTVLCTMYMYMYTAPLLLQQLYLAWR